MTEHHILEHLAVAGISIAIEGDNKLVVSPTSRLTDELRSMIREHKTGVIVALKADRTLVPKAFIPTSWYPLMAANEAFEERAAILEIDAGLTRDEAERQARMMIATQN